LTGIGIAAGLGASFFVARAISSFFYGLPAFDSVTFLAASLLSLLVATLAACQPALRATRINSVDALRSE
jgi:ABC-type antimicrobial peptide transport system permease subunit